MREAGWELPLDDAGRGGTLGGLLSTASLAPRALGFGRPRDVVLGCEIVLADGLRTRCGGRVVKNVTGYDMAKLYVGSLGALGVITGAWLRLAPRSEAVRVVQSDELTDAEAIALGTTAARLPTARSCLLCDETRGLRATVELAGAAASVERDAGLLEQQGMRRANSSLRDATATRRYAGLAGAMRVVVSALPTRLASCVMELRGTSAELLVLPGLGLVCARSAGAEAELLFDAAARAARIGAGRMLCERAPHDAKRGRDVFAAPPADAVLSRALKARFDPNGVLNRGRFAGVV